MRVNVFSLTKVLIGDSIFCVPYWRSNRSDRYLRGHPSHAKVQPVVVQREYFHGSVILRP